MPDIKISFDLPVSNEAFSAYRAGNVQDLIQNEITDILFTCMRKSITYKDMNDMILQMCQDERNSDAIEDITNKIVDQLDYDGSRTEVHMKVYDVVSKNHVNNDYFSWDGMLDDLADLIGDSKKASEVLGNV